MRKYNISANLVSTIEQLYDKAISAVLINGSTKEWFRTTVGIRQGCLLSPTLFNIFLERIMSDALEEHDGKVSIGGRNITSLRFADDIDALAEEEQELEALVESLNQTCERYKMEISAEKTKLMTNCADGIQREIKNTDGDTFLSPTRRVFCLEGKVHATLSVKEIIKHSGLYSGLTLSVKEIISPYTNYWKRCKLELHRGNRPGWYIIEGILDERSNRQWLSDLNGPLRDCEEHILQEKDKEGFSVLYINDEIGKGVFTTKDFRHGDFLLEYPGELVSVEEARKREKRYPSELGSFLFFFNSKKVQLCIDATFSNRKGKYINDGFGGTQNAEVKLVNVGGRNHLAIFATRNIKSGEQVLYDYGVPSLPWRKPVMNICKKKNGKNGKKKAKDTHTDPDLSSKGAKRGNITAVTTSAAQINRACLRKSSVPTSSGITSEVRDCHMSTGTDDIVPQKDYAITEPMTEQVTLVADEEPFTIVPSNFYQVSREVPSIQTMSTPEARETVLDDHLLDENSQGQMCISKSLSTNTNQMSLAVTEYSIVDIFSPTKQNLTNAHSPFKEPVSPIELEAIDKNLPDEALGRVKKHDVGASDISSLIKAKQSIYNVSTPEHICVTRASTQVSNSSAVSSDMISGSSIEVCVTDVDLPNKSQQKTNYACFRQSSVPTSSDDIPSEVRDCHISIGTDNIVPQKEYAITEPITSAADEKPFTSVPSICDQVSREVPSIQTMPTREARETVLDEHLLDENSQCEVCASKSLSTSTNQMPLAVTNFATFGDTVTEKQISKLSKITAEPISASVTEVCTTDILLPTTEHVKGVALDAKESEETASVSTFYVSQNNNEFKPPVSEHIDVSSHGSKTIGSMSVAEVPMLKVILPTSLPERITNKPQSVSIFECSGSDTHISVVAQEVIAAVETNQDGDVCTGSRSEISSTYKRHAVRPLLEQPTVTINPESQRSKTSSTETNPLRQLPLVNDESGLHDVQDDLRGSTTASVSQKRLSGLRTCSVVLDKLSFAKDRFNSSSKRAKQRNKTADTTTTTQTNHACLRQSSVPTSSGITSEVRDCHMSTGTDDIVPQKVYAITEPMTEQVTLVADEEPFTIVPSNFDQVSRDVPFIQTMSTREAKETVPEEHLLDENSQGQMCASKSLSTSTNQMSLAVTNVATFGDTVMDKQISKLSKVASEPISASVAEVCATDVLLPIIPHVKGEALSANGSKTTTSFSTFDVSPKNNEFKLTLSEHIDISNHGSKTIGPMSVDEVPMLKVTLPTSLPERITKGPQSVSIFECSGSDAHLSVVAQDGIAAAKTTRDGDVCTGLPKEPSYVMAQPGYDSVLVTWNAPSNADEIQVDGYYVMVKEEDGSFWEEERVTSNMKDYKVENVKPEIAYVFAVAAENAVGRGPSTAVKSVFLKRRPVSELTDSVEDVEHVFISYGALYENKENGKQSQVDDITAKSTDKEDQSDRDTAGQNNIEKVAIDSVVPNNQLISDKGNRNSDFVVGIDEVLTAEAEGSTCQMTHSVAINSVFTDCRIVLRDLRLTRDMIRTPEAPTKLSATLSSETVLLSWEEPKDDGGVQIDGYSLMVKEGKSSWQERARLKSNIKDFKVDNLQPEKPYLFAVHAINLIGKGPPVELNSVVSLKRRELDNPSEIPKKKVKPHRPCPYCHTFKSALSDHLKRKHKEEEAVKRGLLLPDEQRKRTFNDLKKQGIMKANIRMLKIDSKNAINLIRERKQGSGDLIYCSKCCGFFSKKCYGSHRKNCLSDGTTNILPQSMPPMLSCDQPCNDTDFKREILRAFNNDTVGNLCITDELIVDFGHREYKKIKNLNTMQEERRATLRGSMRRLGNLYNCFKQKCQESSVDTSSATDMFKRKNFRILESTIMSVTTNTDGELKSGLKSALGYLLKKVCKFLHGDYLIQERDEDAAEINRFLAVLTYHWGSLFGDAEHANVIKRHTNIRKPQNLPDPSDIILLREYTVKTIQRLVNDQYLFIANTEYSLLRDTVVCRLTLFNARRGGEPCRLLLHQWKDAENEVWCKETESVDDPLDKILLGRYKLAYQSGKRMKLVPLLIVDDCWKAMKILTDPQVREQAGVFSENQYVFANTRLSTGHVLGWQAVDKCCQNAGLGEAITATKMRHWVATVYAGQDVPDGERKRFYEHMGHSEAVNKDVYQSPLAVQEITKVGKFLDQLDRDLHGKTGHVLELVREEDSHQEETLAAKETDDNCTASGSSNSELHGKTSQVLEPVWEEDSHQEETVAAMETDENCTASGSSNSDKAMLPTDGSCGEDSKSSPEHVKPKTTIAELHGKTSHVLEPVREEDSLHEETLAAKETDENCTASGSSNSELHGKTNQVLEPVREEDSHQKETSAAKETDDNCTASGSSNSAMLDPVLSSAVGRDNFLAGFGTQRIRRHGHNNGDTEQKKLTSKEKRIYRPWCVEDSAAIRKYFERYIEDAGDIHSDTGPLPGILEVRHFMKSHPHVLAGVENREKIKRIKSKIFNERKELRRRLRKLKGE